jgi:hypothetical protein
MTSQDDQPLWQQLKQLRQNPHCRKLRNWFIKKSRRYFNMGRINPEDMDKYSQTTDSEWLRLVDDGDVARVQFLYKKYEDLDAFACHKVKSKRKRKICELSKRL